MMRFNKKDFWWLRKRYKPVASKRIREIVYELYDGRCAICGKHCELYGAHIHHIHSYYEGGNSLITNLGLTHAKCNMNAGHVYVEPKHKPNSIKMAIAIRQYIPEFRLTHLL